MKKSLPKQHPLTTFVSLIIISIIGMVIINACRKMDRQNEVIPHPPEQTKEYRFFNQYVSEDPEEKALVRYMQRQNENLHFVEKTIGQIGYPRWEKGIKVSQQNKLFGRGNSDSSLVTYYIPFVRDSQNYVNASLIINTYPSDTTFSYKCDWQYSERQNNLNSYADSAEYYAIFFMVLDKAVFGYNQFTITDTTLFKHNDYRPLTVKLDSVQISGRNNLMELVDFCQDVTISWQDCPWLNGSPPSPCAGQNGTCDNCWQCRSSITWTYCWEEWVETGGGGGGTGGGGTGGGSGGGGTPPECEPGSGRSYIIQPCEPGWEPIPIEDEPLPPLHDPCTNSDASSGATATLQYIGLNSFVQQFAPFDPNTTTQPEQYFVVNDINGSNVPGPIQTLPPNGGSISQSVTPNTVMVVHTHPYGGQSAPSAADFFTIASFGSNFQISYVIGFDGAKYAMVVNSYSQLQAFVNNNPGAINPDGTFNISTSVGLAFEGLWQQLISQGYSSLDAYERSLAYIMKIAGITLTKAAVGSSTFKKIGIQPKVINGVTQTDPNGLIIYENADCL